MELSPGVLGGIVAGTLAPFILLGLKNFKSLRWTPRSGRPLTELAGEYGKWELLAVPLVILSAVASGGLVWLTLAGLAAWLHSAPGNAEFVLTPPSFLWALPALFLGMVSAVVPMHFLYRYLLGPNRYAEYNDFINTKAGFDSFRVIFFLGLLVVPSMILLSLLALDCRVFGDKDGVTLNGFLSFGDRRYAWSDVKSIERVDSFEAPNGNIVRKPYHVIRFSDGAAINFHRILADTAPETQQSVAQYASDRSGVALTVVDPFPIDGAE
jgi:hypothetical protein